MGALFGALTSVSIAASDLFGRRAVIGRHVLTVMTLLQGTAAVGAAVLLPVFGSELVAADLARGAVAGVCMSVGLAGYYVGLQRLGAVVAAPVVATLSATMPFAYTLVRGQAPSALAVGGAAATFAGLALVTAGGTARPRLRRRAGSAAASPAPAPALPETPSPPPRPAPAPALPETPSSQPRPAPGPRSGPRSGLFWTLVSGVAYGVGLSVLIDTTAASGTWPIVGQRVAGCALMFAVVSVLRLAAMPPPAVAPMVVATGVCAIGASLFYLLGVQADAPSAVVASSLFPVLSVGVGVVVFRDRARPVQLLGALVSVAGVVAVVAG